LKFRVEDWVRNEEFDFRYKEVEEQIGNLGFRCPQKASLRSIGYLKKG